MAYIEFEVFKFTLTLSEKALEERITKDVANNLRTIDVLERSLARLELYDKMDTNKIDVSTITPQQAAEIIVLRL